MEESKDEENLQFEWGRKRGIGGKRRDVRFYESFTFDGVEYTLYDCVYTYKHTEPEPYIAKIIKIWEAGQRKRVKLLWFFRPSEIFYHLGGVEGVLDNELFLASGEGVGLANINDLEAIAGKCNVVCISKDRRNPQPPDEELKMADFVFYRTFDVRQCRVMDKIGEKIAEVEVKYIFNRPRHQILSSAQKAQEDQKPSYGFINACRDSVEQDDRPLKKQEFTCSASSKMSEDKNQSKLHNLVSDIKVKAGKRAGRDCSQQDEKEIVTWKTSNGEIKSGRDHDEQDGRPLKKQKLTGSGSLKIIEDKNESSVRLSGDGVKGKDKELASPAVAPQDKSLSEKALCQKPRLYDKLVKREGGQPSGSIYSDREIHDSKNYKDSGGTQKPDVDRSKWFRTLPWEARMQDAHEKGTLVLLQNLDPTYTSAEVEDIVWKAFKESCTAKMIQRTVISSPHIGQALVIFNTRKAADEVVRKLKEACLLLSHGRPLVGRFPKLCPRGKRMTFPGHLVLPKPKYQQKQREMKEAIPTSHCSQPNTLQYDMAVDWLLRQARYDHMLQKLYKEQVEEVRRLKGKLKSKLS